jgi:folate-binding protein YgfZ
MHLPSPDHTIITFAGSDALTFLQSQLTNDVAALAVDAWQWQGYCSAKGRLQATFALTRTAGDAFMAVVHNSVTATLAKRLTMFRLRAKLAIESSTLLGATLHLTRPEITPTPVTTINLGHGRWITIAPRVADAVGATGSQADSADASHAFMRRWNLLGIEAMQPEITAATAELFVPQMINWDRVKPGGGVSYSKGCYPGQEVVARAHYRGAVKRQLELQVLPANASADNGAEVMLSDGRSAAICNVAEGIDLSIMALVVAAPLAAQV